MKRILILVMCLCLVLLLLVACDEKKKKTDDDDDDTTETTEDSGAGGTDLSSGGDSSVSGGDSSVSGSDSSVSGGDSSVSGGDSSVGGDSSTGGTEPSPDDKEWVRVEFRLWSGEIISGDAVVDVVKGEALPSDKVPLVKRDGFTLVGWFYDAIGEELWEEDDVFTEDTVLTAFWEKNEPDYYALLTERLSALVNYEISSKQSYTVGGSTSDYITISRYNGQDEFMEITVGNNKESVWYVGGVYYFYAEGEAFKATVPYEVYASYTSGGIGTVDFALFLPGEWVKGIEVSQDGQGEIYTVLVDGQRYTEHLSDTGMKDVIYSDLTYRFRFDEYATLKGITVESSYEQAGSDVSVTVESEIYNVGLVLVEAPENKESFKDVTDLLD